MAPPTTMTESFCHFRPGTSGRAAAHVRYIARAGALWQGEGHGRLAGIALHNAPSHVEEALSGEDARYRAVKRELSLWARTRQRAEIARHGNRVGKARTGYRITISRGFPDLDRPTEEQVEELKADVQAFLQEVFPETRALVALHADRRHLHAHAWISPRKLNGKKIQLSDNAFKSIDERWSRLDARKQAERGAARGALSAAQAPVHVAEAHHHSHLHAKARTEDVRREQARWHESGRQGPKPTRSGPAPPGRAPKPEAYRRRDRERALGGAAFTTDARAAPAAGEAGFDGPIFHAPAFTMPAVDQVTGDGPAPVDTDPQENEKERRRRQAARATQEELRSGLAAYLRADWKRARKRLAAHVHALAERMAGQATVQERAGFEVGLDAEERAALFEKRAPRPRAGAVKTHGAAPPSRAAGEGERRAALVNQRTPSEPAPDFAIDSSTPEPPSDPSPLTHERSSKEPPERQSPPQKQQQNDIEGGGPAL